MYILYNQLPLYVCALWKKNKYSFFLSFFQYADQIKTFCFRSDNKWTKSKCFVSIYKFLDYIETFYFAQDNFQTKSNCFASYQNS